MSKSHGMLQSRAKGHSREFPESGILSKLFISSRDVRGSRDILAAKSQSRFLGTGCDEALFNEKKGFSLKRGEAIQ